MAIPPSPASSGSLYRAALRQLSLAGLRHTPPFWRESRMFRELGRLRRDPIASGVGLPKGEGRPVFLIPGYMAGDGSLAPLVRALRAAGWQPETAGIRVNVGCASAMVGPIEERLEAHVEKHKERAVVIGQSRGGSFGRVLAVRRPDLVARLVTLGTPLVDPLAVNTLVLVNLGLVSTLGTLGVPGVLSASCMRTDACCETVWREYDTPLSADLPFLSIYSRSDGIVNWRSCLAPAARHVEVDSSHCGMAWNVDVFRIIAAELAGSI